MKRAIALLLALTLLLASACAGKPPQTDAPDPVQPEEPSLPAEPDPLPEAPSCGQTP